MCGQVVNKLCVSASCVMGGLCVDKLYVDKLCVDKVCVDKLCDDKLCVDKLCVCDGRLAAGGGGGGGIQNQKQEPHTKMQGKNTILKRFLKGLLKGKLPAPKLRKSADKSLSQP